MALSTYADLKTAVADYLARSDLTTQLPIAVGMFESKFNTMARVADMETATTLAVTGGVATLPNDFLEIRNVVNSNGEADGSYYLSGLSLVFPNDGDGDDYDDENAQISTVTVLYYAKLTPLVADADTNWLLTKYPQLYLYGVMVEMGPWLVDATMIQVYQSMYDRAFAEFKSADVGKRWGGMAVRLDGPRP